MTWTFDPLQSRNAHLNFGKLGITAERYLINYYGEESSSLLHQNIGTDRLWARWPLKSERVERRLAGELRSKDFPLRFDEASKLVGVEADNSPRVNELHKSETRRCVLIEIPDDVGALHQNSLLAARWREATRHAFCEALEVGYFVEEFYRPAGDARSCGTYLLSHGRSVKDFH
jgi:predicted GNAT superfamily acetyltransferase